MAPGVSFAPEAGAAVSALRDSESDTACVILDYDRQDSRIKLNESYDEDLETVASELNPSKLQYIYCKMTDSRNTGLPKYVLIQWIGEGAPESVKAMCHAQVQDVSKFVGTVHVFLTARSEDDIDISDIEEKLSKSSAQYGVHKEKPREFVKPEKVGAVYNKWDAKNEIGSSNKDAFWSKVAAEEDAEKKEAERLRAELQAKADAERRARELAESRKRDAAYAARGPSTEARKLEEEARKKRELQEAKAAWEKQLAEEKAEKAREDKVKQIKEQRASEIARLMAESSQLEQQVPTDSLHAEKIAAEKAHREKELQRMLQPKVQRIVKERDDDESLMEDSNLMKDGQRHSSYTDEAKQLISQSTAETRSKWRNSELSVSSSTPAAPKQVYAEQSYKEWVKEQAPESDSGGGAGDFYVPSSTPIGTGVTVLALYDYDAEDDTEISLRIDEKVTHVEKIDPGWWRGMAADGSIGLFPANYVQQL